MSSWVCISSQSFAEKKLPAVFLLLTDKTFLHPFTSRKRKTYQTMRKASLKREEDRIFINFSEVLAFAFAITRPPHKSWLHQPNSVICSFNIYWVSRVGEEEERKHIKECAMIFHPLLFDNYALWLLLSLLRSRL